MTVTKTYSEDLSIIASSVTVGGNKIQTAPRPHDSSYSPLALWQLNGTLNDSAGSNNLTLATGTELYGYCNGLPGFFFNGSTRLDSTTTPLLVGDMTVMFLACPSSLPGGTIYTFIQEASSLSVDSNETNILWAARMSANNGTLDYIHEYSSSGTNEPFTSTITPLPNTLSHVAMKRESNVVKFYLNGILVATSGTLNTPTYGGTTTQKIQVGNSTGVTQPYYGFISSIKIVNSALSDVQILREANYTLHGGV